MIQRNPSLIMIYDFLKVHGAEEGALHFWGAQTHYQNRAQLSQKLPTKDIHWSLGIVGIPRTQSIRGSA